MPIVGTGTAFVTASARLAGIFSRTIANTPASASIFASRKSSVRLLPLLRAHFVRAELVDRLRRQPEVPHDRDPDLDEMPDDLGDVGPALQLHRPDAHLLHHPAAVPHRLVQARSGTT